MGTTNATIKTRYFLFGEMAVNFYNSEAGIMPEKEFIKKLKKIIKGQVDGAVYNYAPLEDTPEDLLYAFVGWNNYAEIDLKTYLLLTESEDDEGETFDFSDIVTAQRERNKEAERINEQNARFEKMVLAKAVEGVEKLNHSFAKAGLKIMVQLYGNQQNAIEIFPNGITPDSDIAMRIFPYYNKKDVDFLPKEYTDVYWYSHSMGGREYISLDALITSESFKTRLTYMVHRYNTRVL